jgi:indolepyruvate ferredoxin oxidoreductase beta subunit
MDIVNIVLCGLGGQGILFMTKVLAKAAMDKGYPIMGAETHGMAQRGGSVISHLRIGEVSGSLVKHESAHILLALEENEGYRNLPFLKKDALMLVNADQEKFPRKEVKDFLHRKNVVCHAVTAGDIAMALGAPMSTNLALIGFYSAFDKGPVNQQELRKTVETISPDKFKGINLEVFDAGLKQGLQRQ